MVLRQRASLAAWRPLPLLRTPALLALLNMLVCPPCPCSLWHLGSALQSQWSPADAKSDSSSTLCLALPARRAVGAIGTLHIFGLLQATPDQGCLGTGTNCNKSLSWPSHASCHWGHWLLCWPQMLHHNMNGGIGLAYWFRALLCLFGIFTGFCLFVFFLKRKVPIQHCNL